MLDTIALMLSEGDFHIHNPECFTPHADGLRRWHRGRGPMRATCNPTAVEQRVGYKPRLTLLRRPDEVVGLRVEFSAPKMVFANNFEEPRGSGDLSLLLDRLLASLGSMGVGTTAEALRDAPVRAVHFSKNVLLDRNTPCRLLIRTLKRLDVSRKLDLSHTTFRNGGLMAKFHANGFEVAVYDKVKDLAHDSVYGEQRGAETDYVGQGDLFDAAAGKPEVLRIEVRLGRGRPGRCSCGWASTVP